MTRRPGPWALNVTLFWVAALLLGSFMYLTGLWGADEWMPASAQTVFGEKQIWRAWSTLFAHGDLAHILGNLLLFFPFAYYLSGHFGAVIFPLAAFLVGGLTNLIVLRAMPEQAWLIGASGIVYWMGGAWMALSLLIDRRDPVGRRLMRAIGVSVVLFVPDTFRPEVSYAAHAVGYVLGILSAIIYYGFQRKRFLNAEILEELPPEEEHGEWEDFPVS